ncbi:MAG TPA: hypothetical protein VFR78_23475 [Pyrinomonadaceae bacterium]|nr:hypothetical protein [Pyrinomonadaceae bacterium]
MKPRREVQRPERQRSRKLRRQVQGPERQRSKKAEKVKLGGAARRRIWVRLAQVIADAFEERRSGSLTFCIAFTITME